MQRPTRILVFGILCLVVGALSGLSNVNDVILALAGPAGIEVPETSGMGQIGKMLEDVARATQAALGKPVYRTLYGLEAAVGSLMAVLLITAGIGLLRDRLWSIRLCKVWAFYALVAAAYSIVLQARYVLPQATSMPPGSGAMSAACSLPFFWLFPVLLLTLIGRPIVINYMRWRASQTSFAPSQAVPDRFPSATNAPRSEQQPTRPAPRPMPPAQPRDQTWRDDPWNDPGT